MQKPKEIRYAVPEGYVKALFSATPGMDCPIGSNLCVVYTAQKMIHTMRHAAFDFYAQLIDEEQKPLADKILREIRGVCQKVGVTSTAISECARIGL